MGRYAHSLRGRLRIGNELLRTPSHPVACAWPASRCRPEISAVCARITVSGLAFVQAKLTPTAERHGLTLALPETVDAEWRARPGTDPH